MEFLYKLRVLKNIVRRKTGLDPAHGISLHHDLRRLLPGLRVNVLFDVGANRGQSAVEYSRCFPDARIYCFEPVRSTFLKLRDRTSGMSHVQCHNVAFGAARGAARMMVDEKSELSFIVEDGDPAAADVPLEDVRLETLDHFCDEEGLEHVDLLKVDTEGQDLEVLRGGARLLDEMRISVLQVEAGMSRTNNRHVAFETFREYLEPRRYALFGMYEQVHEWIDMKPQLRRVNAVFISSRIIDAARTA